MAFGALYDRYAARVYAWSLHLVGVAEAEDLVQEVFLRLWDKAAQFNADRGSFSAWFMAIARHRLLREARRRGRQRAPAAAEDIGRVLADAVDPAPEVHEQAWRRVQVETALRALARLPAEQREVLVLA